jgi:hypothetical protein
LLLGRKYGFIHDLSILIRLGLLVNKLFLESILNRFFGSGFGLFLDCFGFGLQLLPLVELLRFGGAP